MCAPYPDSGGQFLAIPPEKLRVNDTRKSLPRCSCACCSASKIGRHQRFQCLQEERDRGLPSIPLAALHSHGGTTIKIRSALVFLDGDSARAVESKLKIKEMGIRSCWLETYFSRGDYRAK